MRFTYGKIDWSGQERGQENCYLLTNGLGGFSSLSMIGSNARNDQALLMACLRAPVDRYHMVTRLEEEVEWQQYRRVSLSGQQYVDHTKNQEGQKYLQSFVVDDFPVWIYQVGGLQIRKTVVMKQGENTVGVQYRLSNRTRQDARLLLTPLLQFVPKGSVMPEGKEFEITVRGNMSAGERMPGEEHMSAGERMPGEEHMSAGKCMPGEEHMSAGKCMPGGRDAGEEEKASIGETAAAKKRCGTITSGNISLHFLTDGEVEQFSPVYVDDLYYAHDSRDGRPAIGRAVSDHRIVVSVPSGGERVCDVIYSVERDFTEAMEVEGVTVETMLREERARLAALTERAGLRGETAQQLIKAADQFVVDRESTGGKSIIAGYPFFGDWGRDTMIAMTGCCISTKRYEDAKNIFRTFMKYCHKGIMPNMFPEGDDPPMYNTADASLLFISAVHEYYISSKDLDFVRESWETMKDIIFWYRKGTDFHIRMDEDGLIAAGGGLEQVTWMDVRYQDILPTPRHGKPVEINAYWYNDLCVMAFFAEKFGEDAAVYRELASKVKRSFCEKFWNEQENCLKDVLAADEPELEHTEQERRRRAESQIRCNQIWAVSQRFTMLSAEQEKAVVDRVFEELYTPRGLRSLAPGDREFQRQYMGAWKHRDLSYHQGTVWGFPLGGYFLAYLKVNGYCDAARETVKEQLAGIEGALREGCIGQLAEVYDGENPVVSEGCFAQAWSTAELLRVYEVLER